MPETTESGVVFARTHPLRPPHRQAGAPAAGPAWPSFTGTTEKVGTSASGVSVYVDASLGQQARQNAQDLLAQADRVVAANNAIFGITGGAVDVLLFALGGQTDGTGGADHGGCDFTTGNAIEVDVSYGKPDRVVALFEAELSENAMNGALCGYSTGEALSRWCAAAVGNDALADFATAPAWAADGMANWVDRTDQTDQDADSTGCGMAFLSWLLSQGHTLPQSAQQMVAIGDAGTLAQLYADLTGSAAESAWPAFESAVRALPGGVTSDDPFQGLSHVGLSTGMAVRVRDRLAALDLTLPAVPQMPAGLVTTFSWVRVHGDRVLVSGHPPQNPDGSPAGPFGRVPDQVSLEQAQRSARLAALAVMAGVEAAVGDLDRIDAWLTVTGFVQAQPGYAQTTAVLNSFSEVILDVFGASAGAHARTAIGVAALPLNLPVVVGAELHLAPPRKP